MTIKTAHTYYHRIAMMALVFAVTLTLFSFIIFKVQNEIPIVVIVLPSSIFLFILLSIKHTEVVTIKEETIHITFFQFFIKKNVSFNLRDHQLSPYKYKRGILPATNKIFIIKDKRKEFVITGLQTKDIQALVSYYDHCY